MQRPHTTFAILIALLTAWLSPQLSGAETFSTTVKLEQPKKKAKRGEGGLNELLMDVWLPEDVKVVRGLLVNPFYRKAAGQEHWQAACRQWDFGIVGANYFAVRSSEFKPSLMQGLKQLAKESGHAELEHAPFLFVGMSAGAGMSTRLTELFPQRSIAAGPVALEVGPRDAASGKVPMITIFGERDGRQMEKLLVKLPAVRSELDAQFAIAPQWRRRHEFYKANNLLMPLFDRVIAYRYPQDASPADGPVKLRDYKVTGGWLGDVSTWDSQWATLTKPAGSPTPTLPPRGGRSCRRSRW